MRFLKSLCWVQLLIRGTRYLDVMNPYGHIFPLTVTDQPLNIPFMPVLIKEISFHGSCSSTPNEDVKMMEFAARHGVKPMLEEFPMTLDGAKAAIKKLTEGGLRYRAVLVADRS